jgi:hypothetical protein
MEPMGERSGRGRDRGLMKQIVCFHAEQARDFNDTQDSGFLEKLDAIG